MLAARLAEYISADSVLSGQSDLVVAGLPRGGVPVALEVARKFGCRIELIAAKSFPSRDSQSLPLVPFHRTGLSC